MKTVQVYGLVNPIDANIFYVGVTTSKLKTRLNAHCSPSSYGYMGKNVISWQRWLYISKITKTKNKPDIILLSVVERELSNHAESFWFKAIKRAGNTLIQDGGKFCYTKQQTTESLLRRTLINNGGTKTPLNYYPCQNARNPSPAP